MKQLLLTWTSRIKSSHSLFSGSLNGKDKLAMRRQRLQWAGICFVLAAALNAGMYFGFRWSFPSQENMHFREEVSMLLDIQHYLIKKQAIDTGKGVPTMDSIRDMMFGPDVVGEDIKITAEKMLKERNEIKMDAELASLLEKDVKRWNDAEQAFGRERSVFFAGFLSLSLGLPALVLLLGFPLFQKLAAELAKRSADKQTAGQKKRQAMSQLAKENLMRTTAKPQK